MVSFPPGRARGAVVVAVLAGVAGAWVLGPLAIGVAASVGLSYLLARWFGGEEVALRDRLRSRLLYGVPWGTLVVLGFVLAVYLFLQRGIADWDDPLTIPFRAWSYLYPLGVVTGPFAHVGPGHLIGNLVGAAVFGSIAEYAWGHFPDGRPTDPGAGTADRRGESDPIDAVDASDADPSDPNDDAPDRPEETVPVEFDDRPRAPDPDGASDRGGPSGGVRDGNGRRVTDGDGTAPVADREGGTRWRRMRRRARRRNPADPYVRALVVFPAVVLAVGAFTGVFSLGPIIGFSGVYFALAGFALVHYPIVSAVGLLAQGALATVYSSIRNPVVVAQPSPSGPSAPWWAEVAIQGHAVGFLVGVVLGVLVLQARDRRPGTARLWLGVSLFAFEQSLWAVYYFQGGNTYVLYRAVGVVLVAALAVVVVAGAAAADRRILGSVSRRRVGVLLLVGSLALLSGVAVPWNLLTVADASVPGDDQVVVGDYRVTYDEGVTNRMVSVLNLSLFGQDTSVSASGVIVASPERNIWFNPVSKGRIAYRGWARVQVGGPGWERDVYARRHGWSVVGGGATYVVRMWPAGGDRRVVYNASPATAEPVVAGHNVSVAPRNGEFLVVVSRNGSVVDAVPLPAAGESTGVGPLTIAREGKKLFAVSGETRVRVATKETYE